MKLKLTEAQKTYGECQRQGSSAFVIRRHCWADHPKRAFTKVEVLRLLLGKGLLQLNRFPSAKENSFLWICKDDDGDRVEIAVIIENGIIKATAISAYRDDKF